MGHALVVEQLVKHKMVQVNLQDNKGNTALHEACSEGYFDAVFQLLQHDMVDVNLKNYNGKTASTLATNNSILEIVLCLEEYAANAARRNANVPSRMQEAPGMGALLINAARDGRLQDVCDLLQKGADINAIDDDGYTTLSMASYKGHPEIVRELLRHAGDSSERPKQ
jgi:ankyrin repeat protein